MFITPYYIIKGREMLMTLLNEENNGFIYVIEIDLQNLPETIDIYQHLFRLSTNRFCILLVNTNNLKSIEPAIDYLISLSFHYNYFRSALDQLLLFTHTSDLAFQEYISNRFIAQGYEKVEFKNISQQSSINGQENIEKEYYSFLKEPINIKKDLLINSTPQTPAGSLKQIRQQMENAEDKLQKNDPAIYSLLTLNLSERQLIEKLNNDIKHYQEVIEAQKSYATNSQGMDIGYRKQIKEIADFYYYEYEILPLWYKRLGHILKVLTGKRTMKSLFNDNVKKYKDKRI
jgi:hypothetical protein